jgi:hypothetical protein
LLERLNEYVASAGRFPIPRKFEFIKTEENSTESIVIRARFNPDTDDTMFNSLYEKLYTIYSEKKPIEELKN